LETVIAKESTAPLVDPKPSWTFHQISRPVHAQGDVNSPAPLKAVASGYGSKPDRSARSGLGTNSRHVEIVVRLTPVSGGQLPASRTTPETRQPTPRFSTSGALGL